MATEIKVTLNKIKCNETEDFTGDDEVYVVAALVQEGAKPKIVRKGIWELNNGEQTTPNVVLFDENVSSDKDTIFKIWVFDQDASEDFDEEQLKIIEGFLDQIAEVAPKKVGPLVWLLEGIFWLIKKFVSFDKDDLLGEHETHIPEEEFWQFGSDTIEVPFKCMYDGCNYDVLYKVEVDY